MSDTVTPVNGSQYFGASAAKKKQSEMNMETFLNLLVTQLQNQNPLEPMDDSSMYSQMAQLGTVQGIDKLNDSADLTQAQELLGKTVTAIRTTSSETGLQGEQFTGVVSKILFKNGVQYLGVQEADGGIAEVEISSIKSVLPSADVASMSNLIGKSVAGEIIENDKAVNVIGTVIGITSENGSLVAQIKDSAGKTTSVPVSNLYQIAA